MPAPIYRITDVRKQETTFVDMMGIIKEATKDMPDTTDDPRMFNIFVGKEKFAKIANDIIRRINPDNHAMIDTIEATLYYIRWQLYKDKPENNETTTAQENLTNLDGTAPNI